MYLKMLTSENGVPHPPEPLVLQVEEGRKYAGIQWTRTPIALNVSTDGLVDFQQTFVRTVTSDEDWGLYLANVICSNDCTTNKILIWNIASHATVQSTVSTVNSSNVEQNNSSYGSLCKLLEVFEIPYLVNPFISLFQFVSLFTFTIYFQYNITTIVGS